VAFKAPNCWSICQFCLIFVSSQAVYSSFTFLLLLISHFVRSAQDCMKINEDIPVVIPPTVRHLSVSTDYLPQLKSKYRLGRLRTLLVLGSSSLSSSHFPSKLLAKFKNLRVLDLSESDIAELPKTIGQLVHLHYLAFCSMT
jgi:hypothetical protein